MWGFFFLFFYIYQGSSVQFLIRLWKSQTRQFKLEEQAISKPPFGRSLPIYSKGMQDYSSRPLHSTYSSLYKWKKGSRCLSTWVKTISTNPQSSSCSNHGTSYRTSSINARLQVNPNSLCPARIPYCCCNWEHRLLLSPRVEPEHYILFSSFHPRADVRGCRC